MQGIDAAIAELGKASSEGAGAGDSKSGSGSSSAHTTETLSRDWREWKKVKEAYAKAGMLLFGDERCAALPAV